jgi:hypothetical protein
MLRLWPPKEKNAIGAGTPALMPIMPHSISLRNFRAAPPEAVKIELPLPKGVALAKAMASSSDAARMTDNTGPKISSWAMRMAGVTSSNTVGPTKKTSGNPSA